MNGGWVGRIGPQVRGGLVRERGVVADGEKRGDAVRAEGERRVADRVHAAEARDQRSVRTRHAT